MLPLSYMQKTGPSVWELAQQGVPWAQGLVGQYGLTIAIGGAALYPGLYGYGGLFARDAAADTAPQQKITFDTIGQTIFRSIGHCRLPLRVIWAAGVEESGDELVSDTQTFAAAICAPIDADEDGEIFAFWDGADVIYRTGQPVAPVGWSDSDIELLTASLNSVQVFPGDEAQFPAATIVADKGASRTNAFRGIRYVIFPNYPLRGNGGGLPQLSAGIRRTNDGGESEDTTSGGVVFSPGSE